MITVAGGGVGGLTAALLLARNGHEVRVFERRPAPPAEGAGIQLAPNASRILLELGLGPALQAHAVTPDALRMASFGSDREIVALPLPDLARRFGAPYWCLSRADLHGALRAAVAQVSTIEVRAGQDAPAPDPRDALFIVAEGLWSRRAAPARFTGWEAWRVTVPIAGAPPGLSRTGVGLRLGTGKHLVHYPVSGGAALNVVLVLPAREAREGWTRTGDPARIGRVAAEASPSLAALLRSVPDWQVWSLYDRPVSRMADGNVAVVGDAAHPVLPFLAQGAALAIEDAAVLAREIGTGDDIPGALARFDRARRARARRVLKASRENGRIFHMPAPLSVARDAALHLLGPRRALARYDWLYGWRPPPG